MLRVFSRFHKQPLARKVLFLKVAAMLVTIHLALRLAPFAGLYRFLGRWRRPQRRADPAGQNDICWAVSRAGKAFFTDHGCLSQALLGELLLVRQGVPARMRVGVRKGSEGDLQAHAWVEVNGKVVIGGEPELVGFQSFPEVQRVLEQQGAHEV